MKLRPVFNKKFGQWKLCHDQWCKYGETSVVAHILTSLDDERDGKLAKEICDRFNGTEASRKFAKAVCAMFETDANWSVYDLDGAKEFFEQIGFTPHKAAMEAKE